MADPDHENVEYAVLITDQWQKKEVGSLLTDYCLEIARGWGVKRVYGVTTRDNVRMVALFEGRSFELTPGEAGTVTAARAP